MRTSFCCASRKDADAILAQAERSERAVVLGASFIGMEVAASLRERGLQVTVVGKESAPFEKQLGPGRQRLRRAASQTWRDVSAGGGDPGAGRQSSVEAVTLAIGERLPADLVVVGFGVKPVTAYVRGIPVNDDGSITVDATLQAAEGLYAAGDIARFPHHGTPIRVEHWRVAEQHGRTAALNMMGQGVCYDGVPVFWTIQY